MASYVLSPKAFNLLTRTLDRLWENLSPEDKEQRFGIDMPDALTMAKPRYKKVTLAKKVAMMGVVKNTALLILNNQAVAESTLAHVFKRLGIDSEFKPERYCILPEPTTGRIPRSPFACIGREAELEAIKILLESADLVTLTGMGGIGKTRLAKQAAYELQDDFADGIFWVELAGVNQTDDVIARIAETLGIQEQSGRSMLSSLTEFVQTRQLLLLLDNCEHLLEACANLATQLLSLSSALKIIATSRKRLGVAFERLLQVTPLPIPDPNHLPLDTEKDTLCRQYASVHLFDERARILRPDYLEYHSLKTLASICHLLEGIPFAIELAAGRIGSASLTDIEQGLADRFRLLIGRDHTVHRRQRTLLATLEWSYDLLTPAEQTLLNRLAIFADGWTRATAEAVCSDAQIESDDIMNLLFSLEAASLVTFQEKAGTTRYTMLETVRQFGRDRLKQRDEVHRIAERHRDFFLTLVEKSEETDDAIQRNMELRCLEREHENLKAALEWTIKRKEAQTALHFCDVLHRFWTTRGFLTEGRDYVEKTLQLAKPYQETPEYAQALCRAGTLAFYQTDLVRSIECYQASIPLYEKLGDRNGWVRARDGIAYAYAYRDDIDAAQAIYEESLSYFEENGDQNGIAHSLTSLGCLDESRGDHPAAYAKFRRSLCLFQELGDPQRIANAQKNVGFSAIRLGHLEEAQQLLDDSLQWFQETGNRSGLASVYIGLGMLALSLANYPLAHNHYQQSLDLSREMGNQSLTAAALLYLGHIASQQGRTRTAHNHYEESRSICAAVGMAHGMAAAEEALQRIAQDEQRQ